MNDLLKLKIEKLPTCPGCYLMKSEGRIIYVGKAVNLKNRVSQYFTHSKAHTVKVRAMVARIDDFDIVLCDTNLEALILECNLIKLHKPQYNILLKDDKHYPYLKIDLAQDYPRVELVRRVEKDKAKYFGPYMGATGVREVLDVLRGLFPLRTCAMAIKPGMHQRPCLHHQLGECLAPCASLTTPEEYGRVVQEVVDFLSGKSAAVIDRLTEQMNKAAREMRFEQAAQLRDRIRDAQNLMERQKAINVNGGDQDIIACTSDDIDAMVEVVYVRGGHMIGAENYALDGAGDQSAAQILGSFIMQFYDDGRRPKSSAWCCRSRRRISRRRFPSGRARRSRCLSRSAARSTSWSSWRSRTRRTRWPSATRISPARMSEPSAHARRWPRRSAWITRRGASRDTTSPTRRAF